MEVEFDQEIFPVGLPDGSLWQFNDADLVQGFTDANISQGDTLFKLVMTFASTNTPTSIGTNLSFAGGDPGIVDVDSIEVPGFTDFPVTKI